ncbi:hypothetical protein F11_04430 [Rhodospirillum rubrum F11]|nr:hypothetical protein F11_04430 [Rhodospirillum rubrum F11]
MSWVPEPSLGESVFLLVRSATSTDSSLGAVQGLRGEDEEGGEAGSWGTGMAKGSGARG